MTKGETMDGICCDCGAEGEVVGPYPGGDLRCRECARCGCGEDLEPPATICGECHDERAYTHYYEASGPVTAKERAEVARRARL